MGQRRLAAEALQAVEDRLALAITKILADEIAATGEARHMEPLGGLEETDLAAA